MPSLQLQYADGHTEERTLERSAPLTIGAQSFNDVSIPEPGVPPLAVRIGWNKTAFEVTAATAQGVDVNGTVVMHAILRTGDVVRVGSLDVSYQGDDGPPAVTQAAAVTPLATAAASRRVPEPSLFEGPVYVQPSEEIPVAEDADADDEDDLSANANGPAVDSLEDVPEYKPLQRPERERQKKRPNQLQSLVKELRGGPQRPGEQNIFRSPTILTLSAIGAILLLVSSIFYLLMGRESEARMFETAERDLADGKYAQAIERLEEFERLYPSSGRRRAVFLALKKAYVQRELLGSTPNWPAAWEQLETIVQAERKSSNYADLQPMVRDFSEQIAVGSAKSAEVNADESLLKVSASATQLMERSTPKDAPPSAAGGLIRDATDRARGAIVRRKATEATLERMTAALKENDPIRTLAERQSLLRDYPQLAKDKRLQPLVQQALTAARTAVTVQELDRAAVTDDPSPPRHTVWPVLHSRARTEEASLGQVVYALAADSCIAVDTITGEVVWRRAIGASVPFFPLALREPRPSVLLFDSLHRALLLCDAANGAILWQQSLEAEPMSAPVIHGGQGYVVTRHRQLLRFDLQSGRLSTALEFPQEIAAAPTVSHDGEALYVCGARGVVYSLSAHPLACQAVTFTDHAEQAVRAPMLVMGRLLLLCEQKGPDATRLRVFRGGEIAQPLKEEPTSDSGKLDEGLVVSGVAYDPPILRGAHLVVPTRGERLAAFAVDDEPGRKPLSTMGEYRVQEGYGGPLHVMLGPDQQFWMSSTAFRRFQLAGDSIKMDPRAIAMGVTAQPLQAVAETFFVGRHAPYSTATTFSNVDREKMTSNWRTVLGGRPLWHAVAPSGSVLVFTDAGSLVTFSTARLRQGGVEFRSAQELELPAGIEQPLWVRRLHDDRAVVVTPGAAPTLWTIDSSGIVSQPQRLPKPWDQPLEQPPLLLDVGWVLPSAGRLSVMPTSGSSRFDDWRAPADAESPPKWSALVRVSGNAFLAADNSGRWRRFEVRTDNIPHLTQTVNVELPPLVGAPELSGENLLLLDESGTLRRIDALTLDTAGQYSLGAGARGFSVLDGENVLAWSTSDMALLSMKALGEPRWQRATDGDLIVGQPRLHDGRLWVAARSGLVRALAIETGDEWRRETLPQELNGQFVVADGHLWVFANDGTLCRITTPPESQP